MVEIKKSECICGKCGARFLISWELEMQDSEFDLETYYSGEMETVCPSCGNKITAELRVMEKPVGVLESIQMIFVKDSFDTGTTKVDVPKIFFFDR